MERQLDRGHLVAHIRNHEEADSIARRAQALLDRDEGQGRLSRVKMSPGYYERLAERVRLLELDERANGQVSNNDRDQGYDRER